MQNNIKLGELIAKHNKNKARQQVSTATSDDPQQFFPQFYEVKSKAHQKAIEVLDRDKLNRLDKNDAINEIYPVIADCVDKIVTEEKTSLTRNERDQMIQKLIDDVLGLGPIQMLLDDDSITEIMVNGPQEVFIERDGKISRVNIEFDSIEQLMNVIDKIVSPLGRRIDIDSPYVDARLPDGSRVNAIIPPLVLKPTITIRKFKKEAYTIDDLIRFGSLSQKMADFLKAAVRARLNILVSGGTGSGKTTLLNCLSNFIPKNERIITIEDTLELQLQHPHLIRCETRPPNIEDQGEVTTRDLVRNSLRMRPDRIIIGEVRGPEAVDMMQAMNTGHDGSLTTIHANSPDDSILRLGVLMQMAEMGIPQDTLEYQIASALDLIVQVSRFYDGSRKITSIVNLSTQDLKPARSELFTYDIVSEDPENIEVKHHPTGVGLEDRQKFKRNNVPIDRTWFVDNS